MRLVGRLELTRVGKELVFATLMLLAFVYIVLSVSHEPVLIISGVLVPLLLVHSLFFARAEQLAATADVMKVF